MPNYKTCKHLHDNGKTCESPAVTRRNYCVFHLRHRARQLRSAQYRARNQRFDLQLPPLENMHSVQSAISHVLQALAADMIDPKRAHEILIGLRHAASNFKTPMPGSPAPTPPTHPKPLPSSTTISKPSSASPTASTSTPLPKSPFPRLLLRVSS